MPLTQTQELERLLWASVFFSGKDARDILDRCKSAPPEVVDEIIGFVKEGLKKQKEVLYQIAEIDPEFPGKLEAFLNGEITRAANAHETESQANVEDIFVGS